MYKSGGPVDETIDIPDPTTTREVISATRTKESTTEVTSQMDYYSTTFIYSYIIWTRITYVMSTVESTTTTRTTILSALAYDQVDASPTLRRMASAIAESASSSAEAASPTSSSTTIVQQTGTQAAAGGGGGSSDASGLGFNWASAIFLGLSAIMILLI